MRADRILAYAVCQSASSFIHPDRARSHHTLELLLSGKQHQDKQFSPGLFFFFFCEKDGKALLVHYSSEALVHVLACMSGVEIRSE